MIKRSSKTLLVDGERVEFWVLEADPLVREPALIGVVGRGGAVVQDPAAHSRVEGYEDEELLRLWRHRPAILDSVRERRAPAEREQRLRTFARIRGGYSSVTA